MYKYAFFQWGVIAFVINFSVACSVSERVSYSDSEGPIPESFMQSVKKNKTKKDWIVANLGEPFSIDRIDSVGDFGEPPALEAYTYRFKKSHRRAGHVLYVFRAGGLEEEVDYYHVVFERNLVKKAWIDEFPRVQLGLHSKKLAMSGKQNAPVMMQTQEPQEKKKKFEWKLPLFKKWFSNESANTSKETSIIESGPENDMSMKGMDKNIEREGQAGEEPKIIVNDPEVITEDADEQEIEVIP